MTKKSKMLTFLAARMAMSGYNEPHRGFPPATTKPKRKLQPKGLKKFTIEGQEIWALNEKNAIRKLKNKN